MCFIINAYLVGQYKYNPLYKNYTFMQDQLLTAQVLHEVMIFAYTLGAHRKPPVPALLEIVQGTGRDFDLTKCDASRDMKKTHRN